MLTVSLVGSLKKTLSFHLASVSSQTLVRPTLPAVDERDDRRLAVLLVYDALKRLREIGVAQAVVQQIGLEIRAVLRERHVGGILHAGADGVGQDGVGFAVVDLGVDYLAIQRGVGAHEVRGGLLGEGRGGIEVELRARGHLFLRLGVELVVGHRRGLFQRVAHVVGQCGRACGQRHRGGQNQGQNSFHGIHPPFVDTDFSKTIHIFYNYTAIWRGVSR